ncbi:hypothetical protein ACOSQ3_029582 [Xanthoceras sorbifolium]
MSAKKDDDDQSEVNVLFEDYSNILICSAECGTELGVQDSEAIEDPIQEHQRLRHMSVKKPENVFLDKKQAGSKSSDSDLHQSSDLGIHKVVSCQQIGRTLREGSTSEVGNTSQKTKFRVSQKQGTARS